jgi:hypothetical protein
MKLRQTLILGSVGKSHPPPSPNQRQPIQNVTHSHPSDVVVLVTTGMIGATPTPTEVDSVVSQAPRGLEVDEWVGEMIEAEIGELERLRLEVGGDVESEAIDEDEEDEGDGVVDIDEKDGEDGDEGEGDEDDEAEKPKEPKHPKHPKDDKRNHKHGEGKVEKKHKHKGDKHGHEHNGKHGKHHGAPPRGPPHGPSPHGPPHGGSHGGPPPHHPPKPHPPPAGPPEHKKSGHKDKGPRPPHRHHETDGPDDEDQMDDFIRIEDEEDRDPLYNGVGDENAAQLSEGPYEGERDSARQGRHHHHGYHHMDGMTGSGRGHHGLEHRRGFFQQSVHPRARSNVAAQRAHPYHRPLHAIEQAFCLAHRIQAVRSHRPSRHLHPRSHLDDEDGGHAVFLRPTRWTRREERMDEAYGHPRGWQAWAGSQARYGKGRTGW